MTTRYDIVRMPTDEAELRKQLEEFSPFLSAMYLPEEAALFGPINFILDHWLFLWDTGAGYFLTKRDASGRLLALAILTHYRDLWHGRPRLEIHRMALAGDPGLDSEVEVANAIEYLKSIASLLRFDMLYYNSRDDKGNELKELVWSTRGRT